MLHRDARDLAHAGLYLCCLAVLFGSVVFAGASALTHGSGMLSDWSEIVLHDSTEPFPKELTRLSQAVANAREIRAALERPVPRAAPLPPITEKVAFGYLKPGGPGARALAQRQKLPNAMDAMAMDASAQYRASSAVMPELHKVY